MPKLFSLGIDVEEIALGPVMRVLHRLPGVAKIHFDLDTPAKTNGAAKEHKPYAKRTSQKATAKGGITGVDYATQILFKNPMTHKELGAAFVKDDRSAKSVNSTVHTMKLQDLAKFDPATSKYSLTAKGRDRARYRLEHPQQPSKE